jgi:hypothetical protein
LSVCADAAEAAMPKAAATAKETTYCVIFIT